MRTDSSLSTISTLGRCLRMALASWRSQKLLRGRSCGGMPITGPKNTQGLCEMSQTRQFRMVLIAPSLAEVRILLETASGAGYFGDFRRRVSVQEECRKKA